MLELHCTKTRMNELLLLLVVDRMAPTLRGCKPTRRFPTRGTTGRGRRVPAARRMTRKTTKDRCVPKLSRTRHLVPARSQLTLFTASRTTTAPVSAVASAVTTDVALLASSLCLHPHVRSAPYMVFRLIYVY